MLSPDATDRIDFRDNVLYTFLSADVVDPIEECVAFHVDLDNSELTSYAQLIRKPGMFTGIVRPIHAIASISVAHHVEHELKEMFRHVSVVGNTWAFGYTLGVIRFGDYNRQHLGQIEDRIAHNGRFHLYLNNYLDTQQGYEELLNSAQAYDQTFTREEFSYMTQDVADYTSFKDDYIQAYKKKSYPQRQKIMQGYMQELYNVFRPLSDRAIRSRYEDYIATDPRYEDANRIQQIQVLKQSRLIFTDVL